MAFTFAKTPTVLLIINPDLQSGICFGVPLKIHSPVSASGHVLKEAEQPCILCAWKNDGNILIQAKLSELRNFRQDL
jgi:hypothetical protein